MKRLTTLTCTLLLLLSSCGDKDDDISITPSEGANTNAGESELPATSERLTDLAPVAAAFQQAAQSAMAETVALCRQLEVGVQSFLNDPNEETQANAQQRFIECHQRWTASALYFTEPFNLNEAKGLKRTLDLIDTRPFLPGYIDGIPLYPYSGLVHELELAITEDTLLGQHRLMDEESASLGFPVVEFFLWKTPLADFWQTKTDEDAQTLVNRRLSYLNIANAHLSKQLDKAQARWSDSGEFSELPDRAKFNVLVKTLQRFTMVKLLNHTFAETSLEEPEWIHPAQFAGNGRAYLLKQVDEISRLLGTEAEPSVFSQWLTKETSIEITGKDLQAAVAKVQASLAELPESFPFESETNEQWLAARQAVAAMALDFTKLSQNLNLTVVTQ
ncbi:imelysin family protein [Reinekea forsetii]|nr:imelysin family protein [Reinekea forsetii]